MRYVDPGTRPHRCFNVHPKGGWVPNRNSSGGRQRKRCQRRLSFRPGTDPACPKCGSHDHWRLESKHRRKDRERETCTDGLCKVFHPHSIYTDGCIHNPALDPNQMTERPGVIATTDEAPF